jgi:hypothetical protein
VNGEAKSGENPERHRVFFKIHFQIFQKMIVPNLLLIAGTGTKSGKTSVTCKIIEQFPDLSITAIKISPHFHETTKGLVVKSEKDGYSIYEETNRETSKDTSRMLKAGAAKVYFAKVWDDQLLNVFNEIMAFIPENTPVICESPALRNFIEPGVFIIMTSNTINKHKDIKHLQILPHLMFKLEELESSGKLPIVFEKREWTCSKSEV